MNNIMWSNLSYIISNIICFFIIILICFIFFIKDRIFIKKLNSKDVAYLSMFVIVNITLSNLISFNFSFLGLGFMLALGQWTIMLAAVFYKTIGGIIVSICSEIVGDILNIGGIFHFGYFLITIILAMVGGCVNLFYKRKKITGIIIFYSIFIIVKTLLFIPLVYYYSGFTELLYPSIFISLIKIPFYIMMYNTIIIIVYSFLKKSIIKSIMLDNTLIIL